MIWQYQGELKETDPSKRRNELLEMLFLERGLTTDSQRNDFLTSKALTLDLLDDLTDLNHQQLDKGVARVKKAIESGQPILVYGDYDCDGICATALLWETLHKLGATARPFIPKREEHGYGLSEAGLNEALANFERKPLVITVDNGITAASVLEKYSDIEFIITDHHQPPKKLPKALIIHSHMVCGTGMAWVLASSLVGRAVNPELVALATVCDLLPLVGPSRRLLISGLEELRHTQRPGLVALYELAGIKNPGEIDTYHLGYLIGPRINAVGRLGHGLDALRLLCTRKPAAAAALAGKLSSLNQDRQVLTSDYLTEAKQKVKELPVLPKVLVLASENFHEGIIGLVASKLVEEFYRPAVVVSLGKSTVKGSARSVAGVDITKLLEMAAKGEVELGGHVLAAGFKLSTAGWPKFNEAIAKIAQRVEEELLIKKLALTSKLLESDINFQLLEMLEKFGPFGFGNNRPLFSLQSRILSKKLVGKKMDHLQLKLGSNGAGFPAIGFGFGTRLEEIEKLAEVEAAFTLEKNVWQDKISLQLQLKDLRGLIQ